MSAKHFTNAGKGATYKLTATGMRLVQPGETVLLAVAAAAAGVIPEAASSIADLQKQTIAAIEKALPTLSGDQLVELLKLEHASAQPRVTLVQKIEQQQLKLIAGTGPTLADKQAQLAAATADQIAAELNGAPIEVLQEVLDVEKSAPAPRPDVVALIEKMIADAGKAD